MHSDIILDDQPSILDYFKNIFSSANQFMANDMVASCIPSLVMQEDNRKICIVPSAIEIKEVVLSMNVDGSYSQNSRHRCRG
jgi:hypothetical protein